MEKNFGTLNFDATGGTKQINVSFKDGECSDTRIGVNSDSPTWLTAECTNKVITLTAKPNTSAQRDGYVYVSVNGIPCEGNIYWTQDSGAEPCTCVNVLSMDASKIIWEADESNPVTRQITIDRPDCNVNVISVTSNDTSKFSATLNNNKSAITVTPVGEASTTSTSALVTLSYSAEGLTSCTKSIQVERLGTNCDCNSLSLNQKSISWESDNKDEVDRDISFPECITIKSSSSSLLPSSSHFGARLELSDNTHGVIRIMPKDVNTAATPIRDELTLVYNVNGQTEDCTKSIQLTHQGTRCGCGNFELTPSSLVWENNEDGQKSILFIDSTTATCVTINQDETQLYYEDGSEVDPIDYHFTSIIIDNSAKTIKVKPISNQGQTETIKRVLKFVYYANGERCGNGETLLTHKGTGCNCDDIKIHQIIGGVPQGDLDELWLYWKDDETSTKTIGYTDEKGECLDETSFSVSLSDESYFELDESNKEAITIKPRGKNTTKYDYNADLNYSFNLKDGTECRNTVVVHLTQGNAGCSCENIFDNTCLYWECPLEAGTYEIARGNTNGCGDFRADSTDPDAPISRFIVDTIPNTNIQVISAEVTSVSDTTSNGINIYFEKKEGGVVIDSCTKQMTLTRTPNYINCDRLKLIKFNDAKCDSNARSGVTLASTANDIKIKEAYNAFVTMGIISGVTLIAPGGDMIANSTTLEVVDGSSNSLDIKGTTNNNTSESIRTGTLEFLRDDNEFKKHYSGNCECAPDSIPITQKAHECVCKFNTFHDTALTLSVQSVATGRADYSLFNKDICFKSNQNKYILLDESGQEISGDYYADYVDIPLGGGQTSWASVKFSEGTAPDKTAQTRLILYYKVLKNDDGPRSCKFKIKYNFKDNEDCIIEVTIEQDAGTEYSCQDNLLNNIIITSIASNLPASGGTKTIVTNKTAFPDDIKISGKTADNCDCSWVEEVTRNLQNDLVVRLAENTGTSYDRSTMERKTKGDGIIVYFLKEDGTVFENCQTGVTLTQNGYSGDCPACSSKVGSMTIENWKSSKKYTDSTGGEFHAFSGNNDWQEFYNVKIDEAFCCKNPVLCFKVSAMTDDISEFIDNEFKAEQSGSNLDTFVVKGKLKTLDVSAHPSKVATIAIKVYLARINYSTGTGVSELCEETLFTPVNEVSFVSVTQDVLENLPDY